MSQEDLCVCVKLRSTGFLVRGRNFSNRWFSPVFEEFERISIPVFYESSPKCVGWTLSQLKNQSASHIIQIVIMQNANQSAKLNGSSCHWRFQLTAYFLETQVNSGKDEGILYMRQTKCATNCGKNLCRPVVQQFMLGFLSVLHLRRSTVQVDSWFCLVPAGFDYFEAALSTLRSTLRWQKYQGQHARITKRIIP